MESSVEFLSLLAPMELLPNATSEETKEMEWKLLTEARIQR